MKNDLLFVKIITVLYLLMRLPYGYAEDHTAYDVSILINNNRHYSAYSSMLKSFSLATGISFKEADHCVPDKQLYGGVSVNKFEGCDSSVNKAKCCPKAILTVKADKQYTGSVAKCFGKWIKNSADRSIFHALPDKLNFAVRGVLQYKLKNYQCYPGNRMCTFKAGAKQEVTINNFILAQDGHKWWMASPDCTNSYIKIEHLPFFKTSYIGSMTCKTREGGKICISTFGGQKFNISHGPC